MTADDMINELQLHLISEHAVAGVVDPQDVFMFHWNDHHGPCGIHNHSLASRKWDGCKVVLNLLEGLEMG